VNSDSRLRFPMRQEGCHATRLQWLLLLTAALAVGIRAGVAGAAPFMIVDESEYDALRALAASPGPWQTMRSSAISYMNSYSYSESDSLDTRINRMNNLCSSGALAYILDPANATYYLNKMKTALAGWAGIYDDRIDADWNYCVEGGSAFMYATLALDVIRDELTPSERTAIETNMQLEADWFYTTARDNWAPNAAAVFGSWATYKGDAARRVEAKNEYRNEIETQFNSQGVFTSGPGYAWARFGGSRVTKAYYMDILDHTGQDNWYDDPRAIGLNEWLFGGATLPMRRNPSFGDTEVGRWINGTNPAFWRAGRLSEQAAANATWVSTAASTAGLLPYVVMMNRPAAEQPVSRIWTSGYAAFWEPNPVLYGTASYKSLAGYLWTPTHEDNTPGGHAHKDVNALHLCGYGENLLLNSGYAGWRTDISGSGWSYTWDWIHDQAESNNTVLIGGQNHSSRLGGGITEGFTTNGLDYASGNDGPALTDSTHQRNFVFVRPSGGANGYWVLFDEISTTTTYTTAQVLLHPNSKTITTVTANQEYRAAANGLVYGYGSGVALNMFLATAPASVTIKKGGIAAFDSKSFEGEYLYSEYNLSGTPKKKNVVTVLFPEDSTHSKATMTRITGTGITGASIAQGTVVDYAFESDGTATRSCNGVSFRGLATMYRLDDGELDFFFVRKGRVFNDGQAVREGFSSDADVSLFMEDMLGSIVSPGTNVTFYYPGIVGVHLNGSAASILSSGTDWVRVAVPSGTWQSEYIPYDYAPVAVNDAYGGSEDSTVTINTTLGVLANDTDRDEDPLTAVRFSDPAHGTLTLNSDGSLSYVPDANYHGADSFTYKAFDNQLYSEAATVTLSIASVNDAPIAVDDNYAVSAGSRLVVSAADGLLANDIDADNTDGDPANDDVLMVVSMTPPAHGTLTPASGGAFTYTPTPGYYGADSLTYWVHDGETYSATSATVWFSILIPGDATGDGTVNDLDIAVVAGNWGQHVLGASMGDFNGDGIVGPADAAILTANWGAHAESSPARAPEPSAIVLLAMGTLGLVSRRRRRQE